MKFGNIDSPKDIDKLWNIVYDSGELSSAATTVTISNLTGDTDGEYELIVRPVAGGVSSNYYLRFNSDTGSNYGAQYIYGANAVNGASRFSDSKMWLNVSAGSSGVYLNKTRIFAKSGTTRQVLTRTTSNIVTTTVEATGAWGQVWNNSANEITSISIIASNTNGLGIGSRIILLKKSSLSSGIKIGSIDSQGVIYGVWDKIGETTLSSTAQSYTFSNLNGNTDIIYKVIARGISNAASCHFYVRPNNDSGNNYGRQLLQGVNTTISAVRSVQPGMRVAYCDSSSQHTLGEMLIYAKSGYVRAGLCKRIESVSGTTCSDINISGHSWNNTSDEITSIVIDTDIANGMAVGTHLELWRLNL